MTKEKDVLDVVEEGNAKNKVILNLIQDLQYMLFRNGDNNVRRGRCQIKFGMTSLFNQLGFTLIELLVVVLIIGILAAVALPKYEMAVMRSRYATLKANVNALMDAENIYYLANGEYTADLEALSVDLTGCTLNGAKTTCTYPWGYCKAELSVKRVHCQNTTTLQNAYVRYWDRADLGSIVCWAPSQNRSDKYNKLCEKEGGTYVGGMNCAAGLSACAVYNLTD